MFAIDRNSPMVVRETEAARVRAAKRGAHYDAAACEAVDDIAKTVATLNVALREQGQDELADALLRKVREMRELVAPGAGSSFWSTQYWRRA